MPSWSRRSMKHRPPRLRATSAQPHRVTVWPISASSTRPQKWVRMGAPTGTSPACRRKAGILAEPRPTPGAACRRRAPRWYRHGANKGPSMVFPPDREAAYVRRMFGWQRARLRRLVLLAPPLLLFFVAVEALLMPGPLSQWLRDPTVWVGVAV